MVVPTPATALITGSSIITGSFGFVEYLVTGLGVFLALALAWPMVRRLFSLARRMFGGR